MRRVNESVYNLIAEMGMVNPDIPAYEVEHYSQCGEDIIVLSLLNNIAKRHNLDLSQEKYLEIGANHPIATSASFLLHKAANMSGVLVEANPSLIPALQRFRPHDTTLNVAIHASDEKKVILYVSNQNEISSLEYGFVAQWADGKVGIKEEVAVNALRVNDLIAQNFKQCPIFLSIDVEGIDLEILNDLDWTIYRPAVVQVEPSDHYHPGNTEQIIEHFKKNGYVVVCRTPVNLIAVDIQRIFDLPVTDLNDAAEFLKNSHKSAVNKIHTLTVQYARQESENTDLILNLQDQLVQVWKKNQELIQRFDDLNDVKMDECCRLMATYSSRKKSHKDAVLSIIRGFISHGYRLISNSPLFDSEWYLCEYPDVARARIDPVKHYLKYGASEGRNPSAFFSTNEYLAANSDVARAGLNPLLHFLTDGFKEGRKIAP